MTTEQQVALLDMQAAVEWMRMNNCQAERDVKFGDGWRCDYEAGMVEIQKTYQAARAMLFPRNSADLTEGVQTDSYGNPIAGG